jgi:hypothetical protein
VTAQLQLNKYYYYYGNEIGAKQFSWSWVNVGETRRKISTVEKNLVTRIFILLVN